MYICTRFKEGRIPEWPNGADCKSAGLCLRWFESIFAHKNKLPTAEVAQLVEHQPSKLRVAGSNPVFRSKGSQIENPFSFLPIMIIDSLDNLERYIALHPKFEKVFSYLRSLDLNLLEVGRLSVDEDFYINVDCVDMRPWENAYPEIHFEYLDIQIPLTATEKMAFADASEKFTLRESIPEKDIAFFQEIPDSVLTVQPGQFVIFFPKEFHSPIIGEGKIKKVVVKVKC